MHVRFYLSDTFVGMGYDDVFLDIEMLGSSWQIGGWGGQRFLF